MWRQRRRWRRRWCSRRRTGKLSELKDLQWSRFFDLVATIDLIVNKLSHFFLQFYTNQNYCKMFPNKWIANIYWIFNPKSQCRVENVFTQKEKKMIRPKMMLMCSHFSMHMPNTSYFSWIRMVWIWAEFQSDFQFHLRILPFPAEQLRWLALASVVGSKLLPAHLCRFPDPGWNTTLKEIV